MYQETENKVNYTFIIGCARSGTSILGELIASNPDVKYIFEASDIWELGGMGGNESHRLTAQHATQPVKQQIRESFARQAGAAGILVEKSPRNSLRIPYVKEIFPEAKFIHIVRDGRDAACSMVPGCGGAEWNHLKPPSWQEFYRRYSGTIRCAYAWKEVLEITLADLPSVPHLQIRYEDLIASPLSTAKEIFNFIGIGLHADTVEFCKKITSNTSSPYHAKYQDRWYQKNHSTRVGRWRENLNKEEKEVINPLLEPLLTTFGYINNQDNVIEGVSTPNPDAEKQAKPGDKRIVAVLGMHRSGTSAVARGLQVMGVTLGDKLLPPMEGVNEKGFWEDMDFNALNIEMLYALNNDWHFLTPLQASDMEMLERNGFLQRAVKMIQEKTAGVDIFGFKDPRTVKLLPFWKKAFALSQVKPSYVITLRHPLSVCQSLKGRDGFDFEKSYLLWIDHVLSSLVHTEGENCVVVDFDLLMQSPETELARIAEVLQLKLDAAELNQFKTEFLDDKLRHSVYELHEPLFEETAPPMVQEIYEEVLNVARDNNQLDSRELHNKTRQWCDEFYRHRTPFILADKLSTQLYLAAVEKNQLLKTIREKELAYQEKEQAYQEAVRAYQAELMSVKNSRSWKLMVILVSQFRRMVPPGTWRDRAFTRLWKYAHLSYRSIRTGLIRLSNLRLGKGSGGSRVSIPPVILRTDFEVHKESVDVIVCVHNALNDVRRCLESVVKHTSRPYTIILVDDGSDVPTQSFLQEFAEGQEACTLIRNEKAGGYTRAANRGLKESKADYVVLLNSDTLVGPEWIDRMILAMKSDEHNGIVGPLSNTASWQSIPQLSEDGDWAQNPLPEGLTAEEMSRFIARYSARTYFQVPLLNGFCLMIRRQVINDIGCFDEESFGEGYGEEDDYNLRAQEKGWKLAIADDVYIYHAQSKSYSNERRQKLSKRAGEILREKHGESTIRSHVEYMNPNRIMEGIRAAGNVVTERDGYLNRGRASFAGKKILFVLPVMEAGGGANVVIDEARAMREMGVDVQLYNNIEYKKSFLSSYPHLDIPVNFGSIHDLVGLTRKYDATVATANYSVEWLKPLEGKTTIGYYIQGFEPLMYPQGSQEGARALASYSLIRGMKRFTKTQWVRNMVLEHAKMDSEVIGISVNVDLFRPREVRPFGKKPVTITAMIRPESPYRSPELTVSVFRRIQKDYGRLVNILLFGTDSLEEYRSLFQLDFDWQLAGKLTQLQVANLLSRSDIFVDFSTHQAMGLTALEAMACGCSVIVPQEGGAIEFVKDRESGLVVSVISQEACYQQLKTLVEDDYLRQRLQITGLKTISRLYPEKAAFNILNTLFS